MTNDAATEPVATEPADNNAEVAETEVVSDNSETNDTGDVDVWDMTDDQFDEINDGPAEPKESKSEPVEKDETIEMSMTDRYDAQQSDDKAILDKPILLKHKGEIIEVNNIHELKNVAERGFSVTKKLQQISEIKDRLEKQLTEAGLQPDVDSSDVETNDNENEVNDIANRIMNSDYVEDFKSVAIHLPDEIQQEMHTNPRMLEALSVDVANGRVTADLMKQIDRAMLTQDINFQQAYVKVIGSAEESKQAKKDTVNSNRNRLQNQPTSTQVVKKATKSPMEMTDEEFDAEFAKMSFNKR